MQTGPQVEFAFEPAEPDPRLEPAATPPTGGASLAEPASDAALKMTLPEAVVPLPQADVEESSENDSDEEDEDHSGGVSSSSRRAKAKTSSSCKERLCGKSQGKRNVSKDLERVPLSTCLHCADNAKKIIVLWGDLVFFLPFLILFVIFAAATTQSSSLYFMGEAARRPSVMPMPPTDTVIGPTWGKRFLDIQRPSELHDWLESVVVRTYWGTNPGPVVPSPMRLVLGNQVPVGALVVRLLRSINTSCSHRDVGGSTPSMNTPCFHSATYLGKIPSSYVDEQEFYGLPFMEMSSALSATHGFVTPYNWLGNYLEVSFNQTSSNARQQLSALRGAHAGIDLFAHPSVRVISCTAFTFSPALRLYGRTEFAVEVATGGTMIPSVTFTPFAVFHASVMPVRVLVTLLLVGMAVLNVVRLVLRLGRSFRSRSVMSDFIGNFWTYIELLNYACLAAVLMLEFLWWAVSEASDGTRVGSSNFSFNEVEYITGILRIQLQLAAINTVLFFLLILKFATLHPASDRVTRAMMGAQQNIAGLLIIFVTVLIAFCLSGNALFGSQMAGFRSPMETFSTLLRMLLGDNDFGNMERVNRVLAGAFYWAFLIFGLYITLNFIIAVLSEAFDDAGVEMLPLTAYQQFSLFRVTTVRSLTLIPQTIRGALRAVVCLPNDRPVVLTLNDVTTTIAEMKASAARRYVRLESSAHTATVAIPETSIRLIDLFNALERNFGIDSVVEAEAVLWTFWDVCCSQHTDMALRPQTRRATELRVTIQYVAEEAVTKAVLSHRSMMRSVAGSTKLFLEDLQGCVDKLIAAGTEVERAIQS